MTFHAQIITLYPEMFPGPLGVSLAGRALAEGLIIVTRNEKDFADVPGLKVENWTV